MGKKNQRYQHTAKPKEFQITPFVALKGVAFSAPLRPVPPTPPLVVNKTEFDDNGLDLFLEAVADVRPFQASNVSKKLILAGSHPLRKTAGKAEKELQFAEEGAFLEEIAKLKLDTRFTDAVPDEGELQPLAGNRLRQVKRGIISVSYQLDLHGLTREEALEAIPLFLNSAQKKGQKAVLVITGKGIHSPEEPVLHQAVASWLRDTGRATVLEFTPAPRDMGGSGAYVVFLRMLPHPA